MTVKYINNKELLAEIQRSKATYSYFVSPEYSHYDVIVSSVEEVTTELLTLTINTKANKMSSKLAPVLPSSINPESIVFRVMTDSHLPPETDEKRRKKSSTGEWIVKSNFPPFRHYIIKDDVVVEVGRSHWKNGLDNGNFSIEQGRITNRLAQMFMLLVEQFSHRGHVRSYSYLDEMKCQALMHLSQVGLQFNEARSDNPFAFFTQIVKHCFVRIINLEKRQHNIRDDLLIMAGVNPSHTRQVDNEIEQHNENQFIGNTNKTDADGTVKKEVKKRGRKPKSVMVGMSSIHVVGNGNKSDPESNLIKKRNKK